MAEVERPVREKETVVVDRGSESRSSYGWVWAIVVILLIVFLFFMFGGMNMFGGSPASSPSTPTNINVQPSTGQ